MQIQLCTRHTELRPSFETYRSHGILTMCPSPAAFAIGLGPTNPWLITIAKESLFFRRAGISPALWLLVPTFSLLYAPQKVTLLLHSGTECSPTAHELHREGKEIQQSMYLFHARLGRGYILSAISLPFYENKIILCEVHKPSASVLCLAPIICDAKSLDE